MLGARSNSQRLRSDVDNLVTQCANDMWSAWNNTNTSLQQRVTESTEAHNKLQSHMSKTMQEIYDQASIPIYVLQSVTRSWLLGFQKIAIWSFSQELK